MPFAFSLLIDFLQLPSLIKYTLDVAWIGLLFFWFRLRMGMPNIHVKKLAAIVGTFFLLALFGFLLNYQSVLFFLWGIRNNFRFYIFFFSCICFLRERSIDYYLKFFDVMFWLNIPVLIFQYFVLGKSGDYLGGIFGTERGCNGYINIFLVIVVTKTLLLYMSNQENFRATLLKLAAALLVAALCELKVFFLELIIIIFFSTFLTRFSFRKMWIILGASLGIAMALQVLALIFPEFSGWFNPENIWKIATSKRGYTSNNDMNRLTAVSIALDRFLPSGIDKIFGLGLGNCDYASFDFLVSPFYKAYWRLNYTWFSTSFLVLETGIAGLGVYIYFFVALYFGANRIRKSETGNVLRCQMAQILAVISIFIVIYNSSMRTESAYMMYFILSLPFIRKEHSEINSDPAVEHSIYK